MEGGQVWVKRGEGGTQRDPERGTGGHRRGARARKRAQKRRKDGRGLEVSTPEAGASEEDRGGGTTRDDGGGHPGGRAWRGLVCSSLVQLNRPAPGTDTRLGQHRQATWPCAHLRPREQPRAAGAGGEAPHFTGGRAQPGRGVESAPKVTGQRGPRSWEATGLMAGAVGEKQGRGLTRHQPALPRRTEPLSRLPWHTQRHTAPGRAQGRALSPPAGGGPVVTPSRRAGEPTPVHTCPPASPQRRGTHAPAGTLQQPVSRARCALFRRGRASRSTGGARAGDGGGQPGGAEHHWWTRGGLGCGGARDGQGNHDAKRGQTRVQCPRHLSPPGRPEKPSSAYTPKALVGMGCHPRCSGKLRKGPRPPLGASVGEGEGARAVN